MIEPVLQFFQANASDIATLHFMQNALLAGLLVGASCSLLSVFIVLKKMAFIGQGVSHAAFGGVALGLLLFQEEQQPGQATYLLAAGFCIGVALLIGLFTRRSQLSEDSAIGIALVISMALGSLFLALRRQYTADIFAFLFGSILSVSDTDVWVTAALGLGVVAVVLLFLRGFYFYALDEEMALVYGVPIGLFRFGLLVLLAITVVVSIRVIGVVLVNAFLILPGAAAAALTARFHLHLTLAVLQGVVAAVLGLMFSNTFDLPSGATIVLTLFAFFLASQLARISHQ